MKIVEREEIRKDMLPGRMILKAVGRESAITSERMTVCFATYSSVNGLMEPHNHAEETVVILNSQNGWVRHGPSKGNLNEKRLLKVGDVLYFDELEWHVFEYGEGGHIDALCIYGQVDNIRPEEILEK